MSIDHEELKALLDQETDQLYVLLAQLDPANAWTMFSPDEAREEGRRSFERLLQPIYQRICVEWQFCEKIATLRFTDDIDLAAAVADVLAVAVGGLPLGVVTALTVKRGLRHLCGCEALQ